MTDRHRARLLLALAVGLLALAGGCRRSDRPEAWGSGAAREERADDARREAREAEAQGEAPLASARAGRQRRAAEKAHAVRHVSGRLEQAGARRVVIRAPGEPSLVLGISPSTSVTVDGRPSRAESLPAGAEVRASYRTGGGARPTAIAIEVRGGPGGG